MKWIALLFLVNLSGSGVLYSQGSAPGEDQRKAITALLDRYAEAREKKDTILLKTILTRDVDQLVSTGEWRYGIAAAVEGMMKSSVNNPGKRTFHIENIRMFGPAMAIVDCKYEIQLAEGATRKMWSSFFVVASKKQWRISAIRNMLPAGQ